MIAESRKTVKERKEGEKAGKRKRMERRQEALHAETPQKEASTPSRNGCREGQMKRDEVSPSQVQDSVLLGSGVKPLKCNQKNALNPLNKTAKHALAESRRLIFFPHGKKQAWFLKIAWISLLQLVCTAASRGLSCRRQCGSHLWTPSGFAFFVTGLCV